MLDKVTTSHWFVYAEAVILCILFPVVVTINPSRSLLLVLLLVPFLLRYWRGEPILPRTPYNPLLIGLIVMVLVSLSVTYSISFSLRKASTLVWGICLFWGVQSSVDLDKQNKYWVLGLICILGLATSLVALFNPVISLKMPGGNLVYAMLSSIPGANALAKINPNEIGGVLAWCIPISFSLTVVFFQQNMALNLNHKVKGPLLIVVFLVPLVPMLTVLLFSSSRSALGGIILAVGLIIWLMSSRSMSRAILLGSVFFAVVSFAILFFDESSGLRLVFSSFLEPFFSEPNSSVNKITTLSVRAEIWSRALYGIYDFPLTGMGMNTFREVVHVLYPLFLIPNDVDIAHAHNQFLQVALDLGILGLVLYLGILMLSVMLLVKCWHLSSYNLSDKGLVAGLSGSIVASFVFGLTDAIALGAIPSFLFWLLLAIISSIYTEQPADAFK